MIARRRCSESEQRASIPSQIFDFPHLFGSLPRFGVDYAVTFVFLPLVQTGCVQILTQDASTFSVESMLMNLRDFAQTKTTLTPFLSKLRLQAV